MLMEKERTSLAENCRGDEEMKIIILNREVQVAFCEAGVDIRKEYPSGRLAIDGIPECDHVVDGFCNAYLWPRRKWAGDKICPLSPLASAKLIAGTMDLGHKFNPLKMSKRGIKQ